MYQDQRGKLRLVRYNSKKLPPAAIRYSISELDLCGLAVNKHSFKHKLRNTEFTVILYNSALLYILNAKGEPPTLKPKKLIEVLSQYSFKVIFLRGKDMTIYTFLSRHPGHDLAFLNEIIQIFFQMKELLNSADKLDNIIEAFKDLDRLNTIVDILCPLRKVPPPVKRVTRRTAQPGDVAAIWPLAGETRKPEHVPQPLQKQMQPQKDLVQAELHALLESTKP